MKIKFAQVLLSMDGEPMQEAREGKPTRDLTLGRACINALLTDIPNEQTTGTQKFDRFKLAMRLGNEPDPIEVTAEEIATIKAQVGKVYFTYAMGLVWQILEGQAETT